MNKDKQTAATKAQSQTLNTKNKSEIMYLRMRKHNP